ncbi:MAG TPA: hypothetical protein VJV78_02200 [Polyangiales bacterium]|nr:hypothetical protein [Polyangiales bacterium]
MSDVKHPSLSKRAYRIPEGSLWDNAWKFTAVFAVLGAAGAAFGAMVQGDRFPFSYLYAFVTVLTLWLGSIFFILIQHLTAAGWSVSVRRASEFFASGVVVLPILFLPLLGQLDKLYPWWNFHGAESGVAHADDHELREPESHSQAVESHAAAHEEGAEHDEHGPHALLEHQMLTKKTPFLNHGFFFLRMLLYFGIWLWLGLTLFGKSVAQDRTGDKQLTVQLQRIAPVATILFALSLTFAGFDWIMSLEPGWYSTMFGVRIFASSAVTSFAAVIVTTLAWKRAGLVGDEINTEHWHDLGKLMFGFLIFWAYISFGEFFLIWYAAIPEETIYYHRRWDTDSWRIVSSIIVGLKFIFPFYVTMSRNAKRNNGWIGFGASWILATHFLEIFYWIMPYYKPFAPVPFDGIWVEVCCVLATVGVYLSYVLWRMRKHSLIAVGDPRLSRAIDFVQV